MQKPSLNLGLEAALAVVVLGLAGCSADSNASRGDGVPNGTSAHGGSRKHLRTHGFRLVQ